MKQKEGKGKEKRIGKTMKQRKNKKKRRNNHRK